MRYMMKKLGYFVTATILTLFILSTSTVFAEEVTLSWDRNTDPDLTG